VRLCRVVPDAPESIFVKNKKIKKQIYPLACGLPATVPQSSRGLVWRVRRTCQSLGVFVDFIYLIFIYRTYVMYISIMVVMYMPIMGRFPRNWFPSWTLRFNTHVDFWVPFWSPGGSFGGSFGHPWEPFCRLWGTLGPQFRQEGKLT